MIPYIPQGMPAVQGPAAAPPVGDVDGYPKRSCCVHCDEVISLAVADGVWVVAGLLGEGRECPAAPNPDDGPMPGHVPGRVLHPPVR